jgi:hypothetical protein
MEIAAPKQRGIWLDILIVLVAAGLLAAAFMFGLEAGQPVKRGVASVVGGLYIIYNGVLFLLSYLFPERCHVFRWLMWTCEHFSVPKTRRMALFYFAMAVFFGAWVLLIGFGVL